MNVYAKVQQLVQEVLQYTQKKYVKESLIVLATVIIFGGGYIAFGWYQKRKDTQAFAGLVEISKSYEASLKKASEHSSESSDQENPWDDTKVLLEAIAASNSGSSLAPFFIIYQAQVALLADNDYEKACELMAKAIARLPKNSIYYDMFNLKRIAMLLDSPDEATRDNALVQLEKVAHHAENYYAQQALTLLAEYHMAKGNVEQAMKVWKLLAEQEQTGAQEPLITSPWVTYAQEQLKTAVHLPTAE